jgi:histidinol-phosphate phosphatase family protein
MDLGAWSAKSSSASRAFSPVTHLAILAGGKGTRLAAVAGDIPKVLVPVGGKPVLAHQLELAAAAGVREVTVFAGHLADRIEDFLGDGSRFGLSARTLVEREPLGSAGALLALLDSMPEHFLLVSGDVMLAVDLARMAQRHLARGADLTALAHPNDHPHDSDLIDADPDDWVTAVHGYPHPPDAFFGNLVNASLYVVRREALRPLVPTMGGVQAKLDFAKDVMPALIARGSRVLAYRSSEYIKDMGTPERLRKVEADWAAGRISLHAQAVPSPAVFLDRDGTLNVDKGVRSAADVELFAGAGFALASLRAAGYRLVVLTNQPMIARGEGSAEDLARIHRRLEWELGKEGAFLDGIYVCPHHPERGHAGERTELKLECACRKPATGLAERACAELNLDMGRSWMVGDQTRDIEMARRAGLRSVLLRTGVAGSDGKFAAAADFVTDDLAAAAQVILRHSET